MTVVHEMQRIARVIAADQGLQVHVRGTQAFAVPGEVTIPNLEHFDWLGRDAYRMLHGLLDHECGHAINTDFEAIKLWRGTRRPSKGLDLLQNLIEDGYVERMQGARYRGSAQNIRLMNEWFYGHAGEGGLTPIEMFEVGASPEASVLFAIGAILTPHGGRTIEFFESLNPRLGKALRKIEPELKEAHALTGPAKTQDNIRIAEAIYAKLSRVSDVGAENTSGTRSDGEGGEGEGGDIALNRYRGSSPVSATDAINGEVAQQFDVPDDELPYVVFSHEFDFVRDFSSEGHAHVSALFERTLEECRLAADALVLAFEVALRSTEVAQLATGADEGEIDPEELANFAVGSTTVDQLYTKLAEGEGRETAVEILVDCSGSMCGRKAELAKRTALAMHRALQACQITHEVTGFTTLDSSDAHNRNHPWIRGHEQFANENFDAMREALKNAAAVGDDPSKYAREMYSHWEGPVDLNTGALMVPAHAVFKGWDQVDSRGLMHIEGIDQNLDGEAVLWAARRLARRPERRKVLMVLSDGWPSGSRDNAAGCRYLEQAVRRVIDSGMEAYGIGMMSDAVQRFYPHWWVADDLSDLIAIAMGGLVEVLVRNRSERARVSL